MIHAATQYAMDAIEGKRVVGISERMACLRHLHDLARAGQLSKQTAVRVEAATEKPVPALDKSFLWSFDGEQASFVSVEWFGYLRHIEGRLAGEPIKLIDAHVFDLSCIFGWVSRSEFTMRPGGRKVGVRRFRKAFVTEGRKNAKTTRGAGLGLYMMVGDNEENPAVYCTAVDRKQARVLYNQARKMAEESKDIRKRLHVGKYEMTHITRGGEMTAFSGEVKNKDAFNPSCAFVDEYHAHPTSEIYDLLSSAKGQRAQPLMFIITTAGMDVESPCHAEYEYCKMILSGQATNERYFVMIRELDEGDDEHDPKNWAKANPLLMSNKIMRSELQDMHDEAFGSKDVAKIRTFRVKNLNKWVQGNEHSYMGNYLVGDGNKLSKWDSLGVSRAEFAELTKGSLGVVGLDLSKKIDLTADAFIFALVDGRVAITARGFIPDAAVKAHEKSDKIPYGEWARQGWVTITEGDVTDYAKIREHIQAMEAGEYWRAYHVNMVKIGQDKFEELVKEHAWHVHEICYDPYNATHFKNEMDDLGYTTVEVRQTMPNLNEPTKLFRELVASGKLVHDGSPLLKWCVANAQEIVDTKENIMISKKKSLDTKRVDLLTATICGLFRVQPLQDEMNYNEYVKSDEFGL